MSTGRIKLCMIIATLERGGCEKQLAMLAANLDRNRFDPSVVALSSGGPYEKMLRERGVPCRIVGKRRAISPLALLRLVRLLRRLKPDVVHTWMFTSNAYGRVAARLAGVRHLVAAERCVDRWKGPLRLAVDWILARITDRVVANSHSVARWLQGVRIPERLIQTIPNAFDPAGYPSRGLSEIRQVGPSPRLIAAGRLYPQKRYDVVLRAMARIVENFPEARLLIAGEGPARAGLEALAVQLGLQRHVQMPGVIEDVADRLLGSDLFLIASDYEGLPNSVLEAMYVGVPVVATAAPGITDLVRDGATGVLVLPGDSGALADAAISLLRDPARMRGLAEQARCEVVRKYTVEKMVRAYEQLYTDLVAGDQG